MQQNSQTIHTKCGDLVAPAKQISSTCRLSDYYDYGYIEQTLEEDGSTYKYTLAIGGETPFGV
jgi:inorganic pyrophosphatase